MRPYYARATRDWTIKHAARPATLARRRRRPVGCHHHGWCCIEHRGDRQGCACNAHDALAAPVHALGRRHLLIDPLQRRARVVSPVKAQPQRLDLAVADVHVAGAVGDKKVWTNRRHGAHEGAKMGKGMMQRVR